MFECAICQKKFEKSGALRVHRFRTHKQTSPVAYQCYYCQHQTKQKWNLSIHMKVHMKGKPEMKEKQVPSKSTLNVCSLCNFYESPKRGVMIDHYQKAHEVPMNEETFTFSSHVEFVAWKRNIESKECCRYLMSRGVRKNLHTTVSLYRCFRDGHYVPRGKGKRKLKVKGSCKIGSVCPASIKVIENSLDGVIRVTYISCHVGHTSDVGRLNLSNEEKDKITYMLAAGVSCDKILDSIRDSLRDNQLSRIHLTTRKDLWNIMHQHEVKLQEVEGKLTSQAAQEQTSLPESSISEVVNDEQIIEETVYDEISSEDQVVENSPKVLDQMKRDAMSQFARLLESATNCEQVEAINKTLLQCTSDYRSTQN